MFLGCRDPAHAQDLRPRRDRPGGISMQAVPSPVDPEVESTTLGNGLRVTTVALPHLHTATVAAFVKVGSRFEGARDNGLSHFVEHMLFRGTDRYPTSLALNTAIERPGSTLPAATGRDHTLL